MKFDPSDLRAQYSLLSDEALMGINRDELVESAQQILDEEIQNRGLKNKPEAKSSSSESEPLPTPDEEMIEVARYGSHSEAGLARSLLLSADIPCAIEGESELQEADLRLLVPASLEGQALEVLHTQISDEELAAQAEAAGEAEEPE